MRTKTLLASLAVASLAVAQPLSAATRSVDSLPQGAVQSNTTAERIGAYSDESEDLRGQPLLLILLLFGVVGGLILAVSGGNKSPG
jgi:hypothetical protein